MRVYFLTSLFTRTKRMYAHGEPSSSEKFSAKVFCLVLKGPPQPKSACARAVGLSFLSSGGILLVDGCRESIHHIYFEERLCMRQYSRCMCHVQKGRGLDHQFIHCEVALHRWNDFISKCKVEQCILPGSLSKLVESWRWGPLFGCGILL